MNYDINDTFALGEVGPLTDLQSPLSMKSPSMSPEPRTAEHELNVSTLVELCQREIQAYRKGEAFDEMYCLELLRRAIEHGKQDAWTGIQQCFGELVRDWLHRHPYREAGYRLESAETYIALAFERFLQVTSQQQVAFRTLGEVLVYLRTSLNGAILDTLRVYSRPKEIRLPRPRVPDEPYFEDHIDSSEGWELLQRILPNEREQRLAFLLYYCGLKPSEMMRFIPGEWNDVQEIYRLRRNIIERFLRNTDQLRW